MKISDKLYNILKWCAILFLPACGSLYIALDKVWSLGYSYEIAASISAICAFIGTIIGISSAQYSAARQQLEEELAQLEPTPKKEKKEEKKEEEKKEEEKKEEEEEKKEEEKKEEETQKEYKASGRVYLSPSNQTENLYAYGNVTEAENCQAIAKLLADKLLAAGVDVMVADDSEDMETRCKNSNEFEATLHIPIHSNAFNGSVGGCRVFYVSDEGKAEAKPIYDALAPYTPGTSNNLTKNEDLYELNNPAATSVYVEIDFHDVEEIAKWLIENREGIANKLCEGICNALND